ncbi:MAG TPA: aminotransferase class I/II-fold pyridoxal phosphate-dependent enzyme [Candidatus Acidoferrum sp.]|nr:aminotransferase class I/II-fold pyridoxal phosphate-dependent enzyme [Candidatus Acidoferrum sp.]
MGIKTAYSELAIFGNPPAFTEPLHVGRPNIGDRERLLQRINDMLDRRWLSNHGPFVQEFEAEVARRLGVKHCIAMCNGTVALEIAIRALGLTGEVIVPSFTFIATAHALQWQEITPVFCDINERTHTIDPAAVERMITPRTTGIIGVHVWGQPCETEALTRIAEKRNLQLLFDASHAFGCSSQGWNIGNFGRAEVFSFHATKFCNTFEGGAITTNDNELAAKIRLMKNFGFAGYDNVIYIGTNGKMSEVCAAMGLTSLESLDSFIQANRENYETYRRELAGLPGVRMVEFDASERCNYQYIIIEIDDAEAGISRDLILRILHAENILARRYFYPGCHRMEPYRSYFPHADLLLPNTNAVARRVLVLPTGTTVNETDISAICGIIRLCILHGQQIASELSKSEVDTTAYVS